MLYFLIFVLLIPNAISFSPHPLIPLIPLDTPLDLPLLKPIYTMNSFPCTFPFEFQQKIYYECVPEFQLLNKKNTKILFFWCFYQDPLEKKLKKGYCKSDDFDETPSNSFPLTEEQLLFSEKTLNKINSLKILEEIYILLDKSLSQKFFDKCLNISHHSIENLNFSCIKSSFEQLLSSGQISNILENQLISRFETLELENIKKKRQFDDLKDSFQQFRFLARDLQKNDKILMNFTVFSTNHLESKFLEFLSFFKTLEKSCDFHCFEFLIRELNRRFTKIEIKRLKMEVFAKIQGFSNISLILQEEKACFIKEKDCSFNGNRVQIESLDFNWRFWTDFTLINKLFRLILNREIEYSELFLRKSVNLIGNYEEIEGLVYDYKGKLYEVIENFDKRLRGVESLYEKVKEKIQDIEGNLDEITRNFNEFINETSLNISNQIEILSDILIEEKDLDQQIEAKNQEISDAKLRYYEHFERRLEDFYRYLTISDKFFENRQYFCKNGPGVTFYSFQKSRNFQGTSQKGQQIQPKFAFDSTGPFSLKLKFGFKPAESEVFSFKINGSDDKFMLFINDVNFPLENKGNYALTQWIPLSYGEIYEVYLEIRRKNKNFNEKYDVKLEWKNRKFEEFQAFSQGEICGLAENFHMDCEKICSYQFENCFKRNFWQFDDCLRSCSFYEWNYNTLLCLKPFFENPSFCDSQAFFSHVFSFCLLSRDLILLGIYMNSWETRTNEFSSENTNKNLDFVNNLSEKPLVFATRNKAFFLMIDPYYFSFDTRIMKLYPLKSHEKTKNQAFLYYPANKHRKSPIITIQSPDFSDQELNSSLIKTSDSILYMENLALNVDFINSNGGSLIYQKIHACLAPRLFDFKPEYFQKNSQVFKDLDYYFREIPSFLLDFYHVKTSGYPIKSFEIRTYEPMEVLLGIESNKEKMSLGDLDYIERLSNEGWKMIQEPYNEENILVISNFPEKNDQEELIRQCFWDDWNQKPICKDYKPNYDLDAEKKFTFWKKRLGEAEKFEIYNGFLQIVAFVKTIECKNMEVLCTEGQEKIIEIDNFLDESEITRDKIAPFIEIKTNINDCVWGLDESGGLFYRKGVDETKRFGK